MLFFIFKINLMSSLNQLNIYLFFSKIFISTILFLFFVSFSVLNYLLDYYQDLILVTVDHFDNKADIDFLNIFIYNKLFAVNGNSLNLIQVYFYPFIYVFLFVTVLSIIFCLTYNIDETLSFMFYCLVILVAGYILFFTDSMLLFFLSYEMLLIPSFFILYKFAKTRRCVEAAYLMFFWTQFGALFLIFAFVYLFFVCNTSKFSVIEMYYFTSFEVNFFFMCFLIGFGVKLPI